MGKIILLNTPIGNLGDLTVRVREALEKGEVFAAEDTRVFKELLNHLGISVQGKRILSLHDQSESSQVEKLLDMAQGHDLYVASEAGSPIVSDPAYPLVAGAYKRGIKVESYSGVSSPIMALELSGLPPIPFQFHGFLAREKGKRLKAFAECNVGTHIFFEAPTRVEETLEDLAEFDSNLSVVVVRELSKKFEEVLRFRSGDWKEIKKDVTFKGEFVFLFHKKEAQAQLGAELKSLAQEILVSGATPKQVSKLIAQILDRSPKEVYAELNKIRGS